MIEPALDDAKQEKNYLLLDKQGSPPQPQRGPVDIVFKNLTYTVQVPSESSQNQMLYSYQWVPKDLLKNVSGIFKAGEVTAIMGASGAGKTTLLNALACRLPSKGISGDIFANNLRYSAHSFGDFANYVMQKDILTHTFTVRETLKFAADLKMNTSEEEKEAAIAELAKIMKLEGCMDVMIGNEIIKGISGGEKKRTAIAIEIISDPSVLMLDEPTSGLDSLTSYVIMRFLKKQAEQKGKTIITTIHQPNSDIFHLFDKLVLLTDGNIIYQDHAYKATSYFARHFDLPCPQFSNPADFLMSIIHPEEQVNQWRFQRYLETYQDQQAAGIDQLIQGKATSLIDRRQCQNEFKSVVKTLLRRDYLATMRHPLIIKSRLGQTVGVGLFSLALFYRFTGEYIELDNWRTLSGFYFLMGFGFFFMEVTPVTLVFPNQRQVFSKEESAKFYTTWPYFVSRTLIEMPYLLLNPLILIMIAYFPLNLSATFSQFITCNFILFLLGFSGNSVGLMIGSMMKDPKMVYSVVTFAILPFIVFAGFFKNRLNFPWWIGWFEYLSPCKYGFEGLLLNQVKYADQSNIGMYNFDMTISGCVTALIFISIVTRVLSLLFLYMLRMRLE